jgi:hypothetical protein
MLTDAKQLVFPRDAPLSVLFACKTEAAAVRVCLGVALRQYGRTQQQVSRLCGWKGKSTCLSEIARESHSRTMPPTRSARFALATGCNLLSQYIERREAERQAIGRPTERDLATAAAELCVAAWQPQMERRAAA